MLFYVFVAFVGLNNNTILAMQNIEFGSVSSDRYPDPAENDNTEAIPILNIQSAHPYYTSSEVNLWQIQLNGYDLERHKCLKSHTFGEEFRKKLCFIEGSQKHVVSVTLNGRNLKQRGFFLELASWPNWAIDGEGLW